MGSFSWMKADMNEGSARSTIVNVAWGRPFKMLIPKEFGGGFIKDKAYQDYGRIGYKENGEPKHDMYELLAIWNAPEVEREFTVTYDEHYERFEDGPKSKTIKLGDLSPLKEIDIWSDRIRSIGIDIGCYDEQMAKLKYPLKLVSVGYKGTYEDCAEFSRMDWNQGSETTRDYYERNRHYWEPEK